MLLARAIHGLVISVQTALQDIQNVAQRFFDQESQCVYVGLARDKLAFSEEPFKAAPGESEPENFKLDSMRDVGLLGGNASFRQHFEA